MKASILKKISITSLLIICSLAQVQAREKITVSGLITGQDLKAQLKDQALGEKLLLPCNMFRSQEEVFLDDVTLSELEETLQVKVDIVKSSGQDFINAIIN